VRRFKLAVMDRIGRFMDPSLKYWPRGFISRQDVVASRIF
jgi:hypothetical protein